jgi:hypothetical protein
LGQGINLTVVDNELLRLVRLLHEKLLHNFREQLIDVVLREVRLQRLVGGSHGEREEGSGGGLEDKKRGVERVDEK